MLLIYFKSVGQAVMLIKADGGLIADTALSKSFLKILSPLGSVKDKDTGTIYVDIQALIVQLQNAGYLPYEPSTVTYPNFQRITATEGQTFFPFIIPRIHVVFKNRVLMDLLNDYTLSANGITFFVPSRAGDVVRIVNMQAK